MSSKIYATKDEKKQKNREAQAAFWERRTEYIKELETTVKSQNKRIQTVKISVV